MSRGLHRTKLQARGRIERVLHEKCSDFGGAMAPGWSSHHSAGTFVAGALNEDLGVGFNGPTVYGHIPVYVDD